MTQSKYYSVLIVPDGVENQYGIRMRAWIFKSIIAFFTMLLLGVIIFLSFYGEILMRATQTSQLQNENDSLKRYKYKLGLLEENMKEARKAVSRISSLIGVEFVMPELPPDSVLFAEMGKMELKAVEETTSIDTDRIPEGLPVEGFITRVFSDKFETFHPGIDIAGKEGTPIMATGAGIVLQAEPDSVYGLMVVIDHLNGIFTLYGHNSKLLVEAGQEIPAGTQIALLGNTGRSTAPHLHYEVLEGDKQVNPLKYISGYEILNK